MRKLQIDNQIDNQSSTGETVENSQVSFFQAI